MSEYGEIGKHRGLKFPRFGLTVRFRLLAPRIGDNMDLTPLFPSFLGTDMLDLDNDEILKAIRKAEKNSDGLSIHFNGDEPELQKLFGEAKLRFDALHSMFNLRDDVDNQIY